jgi:hypothetical protein
MGQRALVEGSPMRQPWQFQIRIDLKPPTAALVREDPDDPEVKPLTDILRKHNAAMQCQFDAFAGYLEEAEKHGTEAYPLYAWTKATIEDPVKKDRYLKSFTVLVAGQATYGEQIADALERDLQPLVGGRIVTRIRKIDTNPANNPQPPARYHG